jgi:PQQ-like domain
MSRGEDRSLGRAIRWVVIVIVVGAAIIGCVIVDSYWLHLYSSHFVGVKQAARVTGPPIPEKWKFTKAGPISAALALGDDGVVYAASEDGFLYSVDAAGNLQWKFNAGPMRVAPVIGADGTIYVTNGDQFIFAVNHSHRSQ